MPEYIAWCNDYNKNTGEGKLARKFIKKFGKNKVKIITPNFSFFLSNYVFQVIGVFVLWYNFFKRQKLIYLNYTPLWNTLIFLLSPPGTIFGPITGSIQINKIQNIKSFLRFYIFPFLYIFNLKILLLRSEKIIFATNILDKFIHKNQKKKIITNFILEDLNFTKKNSTHRKYDLIIYYRRHENKFFDHHLNFIKKELKKGKKIVTVGEKTNIKGIKEFGRVGFNRLLNLIKSSKFALSGDDNVLSLFNIECLQHGVKIIFNHNLRFQIKKMRKNFFKPYDYKNKKFLSII